MAESRFDEHCRLENTREREDWISEKKREIYGGGAPFIMGGSETRTLYNELVCCFVNGQFKASLILAAAVCEHILVNNSSIVEPSFIEEEPTLGQAISKAIEIGVIIDDSDLWWLRDRRNGYIHYRDGRTEDSPTIARFREGDYDEFRTKYEGQEDAKRAIQIALSELARHKQDIGKLPAIDGEFETLYAKRKNGELEADGLQEGEDG